MAEENLFSRLKENVMNAVLLSPDILERVCNFTLYFIIDVITYPIWDLSHSMLIKWVPEVPRLVLSHVVEKTHETWLFISFHFNRTYNFLLDLLGKNYLCIISSMDQGNTMCDMVLIEPMHRN